MKILYFFLTFLLYSQSISIHNNQNFNLKPIIGVWSQPTEDFQGKAGYPSTNYSYIASAYIQYVEQGGARTIPINYDWDRAKLKYIFQRINGLIFPGGGSELIDKSNNQSKFTKFMSNAQYMVQLAIQSNLEGNYFPVWGTCLGFEILLLSITNNPNILNEFNDTNFRHSIKILNQQQSRVYQNLNKEVANYIQTHDSLYFSHHFGIKPETFLNNSKLTSFFNINGIGRANDSQIMVTSIEGKQLPFYGNQYHPEKSPYIWRDEIHVDHHPLAIQFSQYLANFFIDESRKNNNKFQTKIEEDTYLIYNFQPTKSTELFEQVYYFKNQNITEFEQLSRSFLQK